MIFIAPNLASTSPRIRIAVQDIVDDDGEDPFTDFLNEVENDL